MLDRSATRLLTAEAPHAACPLRDGSRGDVVHGVLLTLGRERLGSVGESGSGKSTVLRAPCGLASAGFRRDNGA